MARCKIIPVYSHVDINKGAYFRISLFDCLMNINEGALSKSPSHTFIYFIKSIDHT